MKKWLCEPFVFVFLAILSGCASRPMVVETVLESKPITPFQRVLIVSDGTVFPDIHRTSLFNPSVSSIGKKLSDKNVPVSTMQVGIRSPTAAQGVLRNATAVSATHIFYVVAESVSSWGPRNSTVEYQKQHRLISDYTYSLIVYETQSRRKLWEAKLRPGTADIGDEAESALVGEKIEEQLARIGFISSTNVTK